MVKVYEIQMDRECPIDRMVMEEDYLKVVEEKARLEEWNENLIKNCKEKDVKIKELEEREERWDKAYKKVCGTSERIIKEKDEEIERLERIKRHLEKVIEEYKNEEETWTLKYIYNVDGVEKDYEQNGMIKEDAEELIGMDSDNWTHYSLTKEERPNKDQVIEGLLIRCESNEELIKGLEEKNDGMRNRISYLENFNKGDKSKTCM